MEVSTRGGRAGGGRAGDVVVDLLTRTLAAEIDRQVGGGPTIQAQHHLPDEEGGCH